MKGKPPSAAMDTEGSRAANSARRSGTLRLVSAAHSWRKSTKTGFDELPSASIAGHPLSSNSHFGLLAAW
jgi:hypothetical protein